MLLGGGGGGEGSGIPAWKRTVGGGSAMIGEPPSRWFWSKVLCDSVGGNGRVVKDQGGGGGEPGRE